MSTMNQLQKTQFKLRTVKDATVTFQSMICEIIANCCERIKVRSAMKQTKGVKKLIQFLDHIHGFFDGTCSSAHNVNIFEYLRVSSIIESRPFSLAAQSQSNNNAREALSIIYNSWRAIWSTSKSSKYYVCHKSKSKKSQIKKKSKLSSSKDNWVLMF